MPQAAAEAGGEAGAVAESGRCLGVAIDILGLQRGSKQMLSLFWMKSFVSSMVFGFICCLDLPSNITCVWMAMAFEYQLVRKKR